MNDTINKILQSLKPIRIGITDCENDIVLLIADALSSAGIAYKRECRLAPRKRIDFLIEGGIGIEVKRGKHSSKTINDQLLRYAVCDEINTIILVCDRWITCKSEIAGKPIITFGLNRLWGVALP